MAYTKHNFQPGTVLYSSQLNEMENQIQQVTDYRSNPNLLDNWYFGNPINQRGVTSFNNSNYGLDRWLNLDATFVRVGQGVIHFESTAHILQPFEHPEILLGKTLTATVLTGGNSLLTATGTITTLESHYSFQIGYGSFMWHSGQGVRGIIIACPDSDVVAVKLEIGSQQTLAHLENGVWVLNEIPDYGEQLRRCRRFYIPSTNRWDIAFYAVGDGINYQLPFESMRCQPSLSTTTTQVFDAVNGWVDITGAVCRYGDNGKMAIVWNGLSNLSTPYQSVYLVGNNTPALIADL